MVEAQRDVSCMAETMSRSEFSRTTKLKAFERAQGRCETCNCKLGAQDRKEFDHVLPCALGGTNTVENCEVLCVACHKAKTKGDKGRIAKADRQRATHQGFKAPKRGGFQTNKSGKWKKKMNGEVVRRNA